MNTLTYPRICSFLERFYLIRTEGSHVKINGGTAIAGATLVMALIGSGYGLVIVPLQQDIQRLEITHEEDRLDHEIRIRAGEISEGRFGVHIQNLTESIDRLINKIEAP